MALVAAYADSTSGSAALACLVDATPEEHRHVGTVRGLIRRRFRAMPAVAEKERLQRQVSRASAAALFVPATQIWMKVIFANTSAFFQSMDAKVEGLLQLLQPLAAAVWVTASAPQPLRT